MISISSKFKNAGMYQYHYSGHSDRVRILVGADFYKNVYNKYFPVSRILSQLTHNIGMNIYGKFSTNS